MDETIPGWHYEELYRIYRAARNGEAEKFAYMVRRLVQYGWGSLIDDLDKRGCFKILQEIAEEKRKGEKAES